MLASETIKPSTTETALTQTEPAEPLGFTDEASGKALPLKELKKRLRLFVERPNASLKLYSEEQVQTIRDLINRFILVAKSKGFLVVDARFNGRGIVHIGYNENGSAIYPVEFNFKGGELYSIYNYGSPLFFNSIENKWVCEISFQRLTSAPLFNE